MEVSFCKSCDNMLFLYVEQETSKLYNSCKACGRKEEVENKTTFVYTNSNKKLDKSNIINTNPYITHDVTLPSIKGNTNIKCQNELCDAEETDIKYIKYDDTNMKFMYVCNHCGAKWKNNL